ncbi:MAG: DinB family protein, partial [Actinomycetota bacterium]|nr:DinB family protein [Actinomycetota bacterium]
MDVASLLLELYDRIPPLAGGAVSGLDLERLSQAPAPGANTIAWLVWHTARIQDHHIAQLLGAEQIWRQDEDEGEDEGGGGWAARFGLEPDPSNTGYGHSTEEVADVRPERPDVLVEYLDAVYRRT